jgi:hypothetical protein
MDQLLVFIKLFLTNIKIICIFNINHFHICRSTERHAMSTSFSFPKLADPLGVLVKLLLTNLKPGGVLGADKTSEAQWDVKRTSNSSAES